MDTIRNAGGFTSKTHSALKYTLNTLIGIGAFFIGICILLNISIELAQKVVGVNADVFPILVALFIIFILILIMESVVFIGMGIKLTNIIKKSHHVIQLNKHLNFLQKPETKIIGLMIGILMSAFMQILAAIVSIITGETAEYLHVIDYFLQAVGILLFSIFVLLVHNPLLSFNLERNEKTKQTDVPLSVVSSSEKKRQSQRHYSTKIMAVTESEMPSPVVVESNKEMTLPLEEPLNDQV